MKHYLYIDESGVPTNPIDKNNQLKSRTPSVFCLGGIIVDEKQKEFFECEYKRLFDDYFGSLGLISNFKLHYSELRMQGNPYSLIGIEKSRELTYEIFEIIQKSNAKLLSFTIDLIGHYKKYTTPINPLVYGLIILFERFFNYVKEENIQDTSIIYERFDKRMRDSVYRAHQRLKKTNFRTKLNLNEIIPYIENGDPIKEPILQFTDFWTYLPFIKEKSFLDIRNYSKQYYNFDTEHNAGNTAIRY